MSEAGKKVVCVTGASGYIALWLVKLLLNHGYTVKAIIRDPIKSSDSTISDLKSLLQSSTNVLPRGGILIDSKTLRSSGISNGAKIMLMASQGLHQGEGPKIKDAPVVSNHRKIMNADRISKPTQEVPVEKKRTGRWKIMGDIGLSDHHLKV
ncbi:hypothetical protein RDABS01_013790 [Bienertia sinuspersici]